MDSNVARIEAVKSRAKSIEQLALSAGDLSGGDPALAEIVEALLQVATSTTTLAVELAKVVEELESNPRA